MKDACIISNTPEQLKTHLQLNVGKLGNCDALRVATDDYLRSRRIFKTTSNVNKHDENPIKVNTLSKKGKEKKKNSARARKAARQATKTTHEKVTESKAKKHLRTSKVRVENVESTVGTSGRRFKAKENGK